MPDTKRGHGKPWPPTSSPGPAKPSLSVSRVASDPEAVWWHAEMRRLSSGALTLVHGVRDDAHCWASLVRDGTVARLGQWPAWPMTHVAALNDDLWGLTSYREVVHLTQDGQGEMWALPPRADVPDAHAYGHASARLNDGTLVFAYTDGTTKRDARLWLLIRRPTGEWVGPRDVSTVYQRWVICQAIAQHPVTGHVWLVTNQDASGQFCAMILDPATWAVRASGLCIYAAYQGEMKTVAPNGEIAPMTVLPWRGHLIAAYGNADGLYYAEDQWTVWPTAKAAIVQLRDTLPLVMSPPDATLLAASPESMARMRAVSLAATAQGLIVCYPPIVGLAGSTDPAMAGTASSPEALRTGPWVARAWVPNAPISDPIPIGGNGSNIAWASDEGIVAVYDASAAAPGVSVVRVSIAP